MQAIILPVSYYEPEDIGHYAECDHGAGFYCQPCNHYIQDGAKYAIGAIIAENLLRVRQFASAQFLADGNPTE